MNASPRPAGDLADDLIADLLRSAWLVESGRARIYGGWAFQEPRFGDSESRATRRAAIVARAVAARGKRTDRPMVGDHASWIASLAGHAPGAVPLGDLFVARIGDWVDAHAAGFLDEGADELIAVGVEEKETLSFPEAVPPAPGFEPLAQVAAQPPGDVLLRIGVLSDLHFGSARAEPLARAAIADINRAGVDLVVQLGDITDHGNKDEFDTAVEVLSGLEAELVTMIGNHDVYSYAEDRLAGRAYYETAFGRAPDGLLLERKGFRIAALDSAEHGVSPFPPFDIVSGRFTEGTSGAVVRGSLSVPQHEILAEVAAPGRPPTFVFMHHPPQPFAAFPPVVFGLRDADSGRLHAVCDSGNVWGVFAGHTHRNARSRLFGTVPVQEVAIPRDYPFGYALIDATENGYAYRFLQVSDQDLLRESYETAGQIHRSYGRGPGDVRAFVWTKNRT